MHVARLGFDQKINVKAGENSGRKLLHDFVVLSLVSGPLNSDETKIRLPVSAARLEPNPRGAIVRLDHGSRPDGAGASNRRLAAMTAIKDYALIGNCETAALINPNGGIDWLCLPSFDSPSLFGKLLDDDKGGSLELRPSKAFEVSRQYLDDSAILQTTFTTASGVVRLTDFFVVARKADARFYDFTSLHSTGKLVRLVELQEGGGAEMQLHVEARPDYARKPPAWREIDAGSYALDETALFTNAQLRRDGHDLLGRFTVERAAPLFLVLDYTDDCRLPRLEQIRRWLRTTEAFWRDWNLFNYYAGPHRTLVRRSAVTLKLLTYAGTGAFVAGFLAFRLDPERLEPGRREAEAWLLRVIRSRKIPASRRGHGRRERRGGRFLSPPKTFLLLFSNKSKWRE